MSRARSRRTVQIRTNEEDEEELRKKIYELRIADKQELLEKEFEKELLQQNLEEQIHGSAEAGVKAFFHTHLTLKS